MSTTNNIPSVKAKITWINDDPAGAKKAAASVTIADSFQVHGVSIVEGSKGLFISMPQRQTTDKKFVEVAHPITSEMRQAIYDAVFKAYSQTMAISDQYNASFRKSVEDAQSSASQGNAKSEEQPTEVTEPAESTDSAEDSLEDEEQAPIMGQMM